MVREACPNCGRVFARLAAHALICRVPPPPPIVAPPIVAPPIVAPPIVAPPVVAPPIVAPPIVAPPIVAPPLVAPPLEPAVVVAPPLVPVVPVAPPLAPVVPVAPPLVPAGVVAPPLVPVVPVAPPLVPVVPVAPPLVPVVPVAPPLVPVVPVAPPLVPVVPVAPPLVPVVPAADPVASRLARLDALLAQGALLQAGQAAAPAVVSAPAPLQMHGEKDGVALAVLATAFARVIGTPTNPKLCVELSSAFKGEVLSARSSVREAVCRVVAGWEPWDRALVSAFVNGVGWVGGEWERGEVYRLLVPLGSCVLEADAESVGEVLRLAGREKAMANPELFREMKLLGQAVRVSEKRLRSRSRSPEREERRVERRRDVGRKGTGDGVGRGGGAGKPSVKTPFTGRCFNCGNPGHKSGNCRKPKKQ